MWLAPVPLQRVLAGLAQPAPTGTPAGTGPPHGRPRRGAASALLAVLP